jgi:predicted alpha/beta superfamily hydrolase
MVRFRLAASVFAAVGLAAGVCAAAAAPSPAQPEPSAAARLGHPHEVVIEDTRRIAFVSGVNGHRYSIDVSIPDTPPPPEGYPVIYVLDGDGYFTSVVGAVRMNGNAPNAVVVGVGYPRDPAWAQAVLSRHRPLPPAMAEGRPFDTAVELERQYDLSPPADTATRGQMTITGVRMSAPDFGGVDSFLKTIEIEIKPRVAALARIDKGNQTLFGHSLGGLAVVEALFTEPGAYRTFVAASPSIWWADRAVLKHEGAFDALIAAGAATPRVMVTVGALEDAVPKLPPDYAGHLAEVKAMIAKARMVGNACDLATRLKALKGAPGYEVADCVVFPEQSHGISVWPAIGRAVSFAYPN